MLNKRTQVLLVILFILSTIGIFLVIFGLDWARWQTLFKDLWFWGFIALWVLMINEGLTWIKNGKRSEASDLVVIGFLFFAVYLFTRDVFDSFIGAFSIYLLLGIFELKDYEVLNKILLITVITYNVIFFSGIVSTILNNDVIRDTAFSMSFWLMLILGFALFGRKYIVVWRFLSPQYLTLGLYLVAWLGLVTVTKITGVNIYGWIYELLILTNFVIYAVTGPLIDLMLGMKPTDDPTLHRIVEEVAGKLGMNPKKIKVRFGQYPILNAMAYGAFWDMRMGIIAPSIQAIPEDELKGIVAHELAHLKGMHTLSLTIISSAEIVIRKFLKWPVTYYDYVFAPDSQPYSMFWFIVINLAIAIFLYVFVRMFEAQADLNTKRYGYGKELAKGLYNLESFYASGREIGLNTMLLCDEPISKEHRMLDYLDTAEYLNKMIIKPSKGALLSNFLNSHPPSYHRIIAALGDEDIPIGQEALMPLTFLSKKRAKRFFLKTEIARQRYRELATQKVKNEFGLASIDEFMNSIKRAELYTEKIGKHFVIRDLATNRIRIGRLDRVFFVDDASEAVRFEFHPTELSTFSDPIEINPLLVELKEFALNEVYYVPNLGTVKLLAVDPSKQYRDPKKKSQKSIDKLSPEKLADITGVFVFQILVPKKASKITNSEKPIIEKPIFDTRLSQPVSYFEKLINKPVFYKTKSAIQLKKLAAVTPSTDYKKIELVLMDYANEKPVSENILQFPLDQAIVVFGHVAVPIHNDKLTKDAERKIWEYLIANPVRASLYLKKAVNMDEHGHVTQIIYVPKESSDNVKIKQAEEKNGFEVKIHTIFGQEKSIPVQKIDMLTFDQPTIVIEMKKESSSMSVWLNQITAYFKPDKILL
jgi:Zn-dependent protease with chaperone function